MLFSFFSYLYDADFFSSTKCWVRAIWHSAWEVLIRICLEFLVNERCTSLWTYISSLLNNLESSKKCCSFDMPDRVCLKCACFIPSDTTVVQISWTTERKCLADWRIKPSFQQYIPKWFLKWIYNKVFWTFRMALWSVV